MKTLVINRKWWLRGSNVTATDGSCLLSKKSGRMCCLGFLALDICNLNPLDILNYASPEELFPDEVKLPDFLAELVECWDYDKYYQNSEFTYDAIEINDSSQLSDEQREKALIKLFHEAGIKLEFVD